MGLHGYAPGIPGSAGADDLQSMTALHANDPAAGGRLDGKDSDRR